MKSSLAPESVTLLLHEGKGALYGPRGFAPFETGDNAGWIGGRNDEHCWLDAVHKIVDDREIS